MAEQQNSALRLSPRFTSAVEYAREIHVGFRKGTEVPYMAHLLGVASLVLRESGHVPFPVTEDMVIAALLHDAVEDEGGLPRLRDIEKNFGREVAKIIEGCTDFRGGCQQEARMGSKEGFLRRTASRISHR
jgi:(p)ppGpp synthase/HD superfamily hydrolase